MPDKIRFTVQTDEWERFDHPAELQLDTTEYELGFNKVNLIEVDSQGNSINEAVPFQIDENEDETLTITILLTGQTPPLTERHYEIVSTESAPKIDPLIEYTDGVMHEEQESYRIKTPSATYVYHKFGAGFASMFDNDGNDWLSYRPYGGSDGKFRGIPNVAHPENHFHPGGTGCNSRIVNSGSLKLTIASESNDGKWACVWEIFPSFARLTILKVDHPYWLLYEGTPGGKLDEAGDYCVQSHGTRLALTERWERPLPAPEWIYFGASNTERVLYLVHHEADDHMDSYWSMEENMTVFGFGRNGLEKYMTETPSHFTIGFAENGEFDKAQNVIHAAFEPLTINLNH